MPNEFDFVKEEYLSLRKEIENCIAEMSSLERNCVIAAAVAFAWVATQSMNSAVALIAWLLPSVIPGLGVLRALAIRSRLSTLSEYIKTIEKAQLPYDTPVIGWEHYLLLDPAGSCLA